MHIKTCLLVLLVSLTWSTTTLAHEPRENVSGAFTLVVGNRVEPAYAGQANKFDLFIRDPNGNPINSAKLDLHVIAIYLKDENFDSKILASSRLKGELKQDAENQSRFNIDYLPTIIGTYGFILKGTINDVYMNEKYVCGNGSQHPQGRAFSCITELQEFPHFSRNKHSPKSNSARKN